MALANVLATTCAMNVPVIKRVSVVSWRIIASLLFLKQVAFIHHCPPPLPRAPTPPPSWAITFIVFLLTHKNKT